jgi:hypothetical protein
MTVVAWSGKPDSAAEDVHSRRGSGHANECGRHPPVWSCCGGCMESPRWLRGLVIGVHRAGGRKAG